MVHGVWASLFDHEDYKSYLNAGVAARGRGEKTRLAQSIRCHLAYVSQILNGPAHLSLEQADLVNEYLAHNELEAEYFLLLVCWSRAGSSGLARRYEAKVRKMKLDWLTVENRIKEKKSLAVENQATYYRAWYYSAIHLLISIPGFQTKDKLARQLNLPMSRVTQVLDFLVTTGLATSTSGKYQSGQVTLHMKNDSPWAMLHHSTWRTQAIRAIEQEEPKNFHYTSTVSMSEDDVPAVRKIMVDAIEKIRAVVRASPEERAYCYTVDFFKI